MEQKGILVGQKRPLQPKNVWSIRVRLEISGATRELALYSIWRLIANCEHVIWFVCEWRTFAPGTAVRDRAATIIQKKTTDPSSSKSLNRQRPRLRLGFPSFESWAETTYFRADAIGQIISLRANTLGSSMVGFLASAWIDGVRYPFMRRTKAAQIYKKTGNLRAVQLLLGHTKLESTVRYLGIEVDDALRIAEQIEL